MAEEEVLLETSRFRVARVRHQTAAGVVFEREVIRHPGAVVILPLVDNHHVCLIRNYRVAVGRTLLELPAGTLEPGEDPADTAHRELIEETGYRAGSIEFLRNFYLSPGILDEQMHLYVATDLQEGPAAPEPNEEIANEIVAWPEALEMVADGRINDAKTIVGLLAYRYAGKAGD